MASKEDRVFKVTFETVTRQVTESQLKKAPDSLLSRVLLCEDRASDDCSDTLVIPSKDKSPACAAWQDGTADLFQVLSVPFATSCASIVSTPVPTGPTDFATAQLTLC